MGNNILDTPRGATASYRAYPLARVTARRVWGSARGPSKDHLIAVYKELEAYYDAGGSQADPTGAITVVGAVSTVRKWSKFESAWEALLAGEGVSSLHMTDLAAGVGEYKNWTDSRAGKFVNKLIAVTKQGIFKSFALTLPLDDYREVDKEFVISEAFGRGHPRSGPYAVCAASCMARMGEWVSRKYPGASIAHIHENGDYGRGALLSYIDHEPSFGQAAISFLPKYDKTTGRYIRQFECVDMVAWAWRRFHITARKLDLARGDQMRFPMIDRIYQMLPCQSLFHDADSMRKACLHRPELFPPRV